MIAKKSLYSVGSARIQKGKNITGKQTNKISMCGILNCPHKQKNIVSAFI
jgi:hypothetical protein